jgi:hypothetical protein
MRSALLTSLCVIVLALVPAEASAFHYTHRVTATATVTDDWTVDEQKECGALGPGSVTATLKTVTYAKVRPMISKYGARPIGRKLGLWVLAVPVGGGYAGVGVLKATGSITTVDSTVLKPAWFGDCGLPDTSKCGTFPLKGTIDVGGFDFKHLYGKASVDGGDFSSTSDCAHGGLGNFSLPVAAAPGVGPDRLMTFKMPSKSKLRKRKSITLKQTDHRTTSYVDTAGGSGKGTDDVTRTISVTLEKL